MKVIIVGTGPMARSVAHCLRRINKGKQTYELLGFIGDRLPGIAAEPYWVQSAAGYRFPL